MAQVSDDDIRSSDIRTPGPLLDDVSMQIIRELQRDGRRPYTSIAKTIGLSEAAVRQRVQRLLDAGVMQIVAVTDPLRVGFHRQAMVGIKVDGDVRELAAKLQRQRGDRLRRHLLGHVRPPRRAHRARRRAPARSDQHADPIDPGHPLDRDVRLPAAREADLLLGNVMTTTTSDSLTAAAHRYLWMHFTPMPRLRHRHPGHRAGRGRVGLRPERQALPRRPRRACSCRRSVTVAPSSPTPPPTQARKLAYFPVWSYAHPGAIELAERLADLAPGDLERVFFTTGGSEAVESAWKLARQYFQAIGQPNRYKVIGRHIAYHGTTMGALSITGVPAIKAPFEPLVPGAVRVVEHQPVPARADRSRGGDRARDRDGRARERRRGVPRAGAELGRLLPADRGLLPARPRDLRRDRRAARLRRGDLRVRPARSLVRLAALRLPARHHHDGEGHDVGLLPDRRHDRAPVSRRAVPARPQDVPARHHVRAVTR